MNRGSGAVGVLVAVVVLALALPLSSHAAFPGRNGKLAFGMASFVDGQPNTDIWTVEPPSSELQRLTSDPLSETAPSWSPNGRWIAFTRSAPPCCPLNGDIWIARSDGTDQRRIVDHVADDKNPVWSPDGKQIVFASLRNDPTLEDIWDYDLFIINTDGTGLRTLVSEPPGRSEENASWSPDGRKIAYDSFYSTFSVRTISPDGTGEQLVTPAEELAIEPDWSPDGALLAYSSGTGLLTVRPDGSDRRALPAPHRRIHPAWSPDGTKMAFAGDFLGHMNVDGSGLVLLAGDIFTPGGISWQPLGPRREDFKNRPAFCRAEREFLGEEEFTAQYRNFGACVSAQG